MSPVLFSRFPLYPILPEPQDAAGYGTIMDAEDFRRAFDFGRTFD